jgi:hypothetical protein
MPDVRYELPGLSRGPAAGLTAFMPHFNRYAASGAQSYKYAVRGWPGNMAHPAPTVDTVPSPDLGDLAQAGYARSVDAPQAWWPQDYDQTFIAERPGAGMPIQYYDPTRPGLTTVLPVPSTDYRALYQKDSYRNTRRAILNRVRQLPWWPREYVAEDGIYNG